MPWKGNAIIRNLLIIFLYSLIKCMNVSNECDSTNTGNYMYWSIIYLLPRKKCYEVKTPALRKHGDSDHWVWTHFSFTVLQNPT